MDKPLVVWISQLAGTESYDIPVKVLDSFEVRTTSVTDDIESLIVNHSCVGVFVEFDYPDRRRLEMFARAIAHFPSIPFVMVTLQHSESLAVWSFRIGAMDFLVKPLQNMEVERCVDNLLRDQPSVVRSRKSRAPNGVAIPIPDTVPRMPNSKKQQLAPALTYVRLNYSERIVTDGMARLCGMSSSKFGRAFKQVYDMTFQEFIVRYRVFRAFDALRAPEANISEIAHSVGFSDPSYFTRVFRRYVGVAPSEVSAADAADIKCALEPELFATDDNSTSQLVRSLSASFKT